MENALKTGLACVGFAAATLLTGALGALATRKSQRTWYRALRKSRLNPPDKVFGPVWTVLYAASSLSATRVFRAEPSPERTRALALWGAQQTFNALWTPLFFGQRKATAALVDLGLLWASLAAYAKTAGHVDRRAAELVVPYLAWVTFAGLLNGAVVMRNPRWLHG
jgi:tryptophan-rich sensory protein